MTDLSPKQDSQHCIVKLRTTCPYDGRRVTLSESRGGWKYASLTGICMHLAADHRHMVLKVEHDPESYWPIGMEILAELDHETVPQFHTDLSRVEAHEELRRLSGVNPTSATARAAAIVLDEVTRLRQLLRDLVDFDMGELPEIDALCAVAGPRKIERAANAWSASIAEVGPRDQRRFEGV